MFNDFTTQIQSDEFASRYDEAMQAFEEFQEMACAEADDAEMAQFEAEWLEWRNEEFPGPTDEELDAMERDYYENYGY